MGDNVVLRFQYSGKDTDIVVQDVDKVNLVDLIIEYWEIAEREQTTMPKHPEFTYIHKMKHVELKNDMALMKMFVDLSGRDLIYIWVGELQKSTPIVEIAQSLKASRRMNTTESSDHIQPRPTLDQSNEPHLTKKQEIETLKQAEVTFDMAPPRSPININELIVDNMEYWNNIEITTVEPNRGRGRGRGNGKVRGGGRYGGKGRGRVTSTPIVEPIPDLTQAVQIRRSPINHSTQTSSAFQVGESSKYVKFSPLLKKRIPRTTAKRRGLITTTNVGRGSAEQGNNRRHVAFDLTPSLDTVAEMDLDLDYIEIYSPNGLNDNDNESALSDDDDEGEGQDDWLIPMIHDNFDPYEGPVWEDDCDDLDNYLQRLYKNGEFYKDEDFGKIVVKPWQLYTDKQHLRDVVKNYCIQNGFSVIVEKASNFTYTVRCSDERCLWRLHASRLVDGVTWAIKSIQGSEHTCMGLETRNPMVTTKWACKVLLEDIRANNDIPAKALNELLWSRYRVQMAQSSLYRMRTMALTEIHGGHDVSYSYLPNYYEVIKETNPNSLANCAWNPPNHPEKPLAFTSIFICFKVTLDGLFAGCRGLIGVDGTFLKGNYRGVLLSAVALDGNNEMFPVAWAIVSGEDEETWKFFVWHLKNALHQGDRGDDWCIISDRHKAIEKACAELWPKVGRRYCCKHLSVNWKKPFSGPKMLQLFWLACGAYSEFTFKKAMTQIQKVKPAARIWLANLGDQERWTKHKFNPTLKCDVNKTNFVESFNATLGIDRCRPVLTLLEGIKRVTMVRLATRREICEKWDRRDVCPNIVKRVQVLCSDSRTCRAYLSSQGEYEIVDGKSSLSVSLNNHTCLCNAWQLTGIPCKHGMRAILHAGLDPLRFVHEWYSVKRYKMAYANGIKSVPDREQWPQTDVLVIQPPVMKRGVGRLVKNRKRGEEEQRKGKRSKTLRCGNCGDFGHNILTCQRAPTQKQKKAQSKKKNAM